MIRESFWVIAYDITADRRRTKIVKVLKNYGGQRANFSVFECRLAPEAYARLKAEIGAIIKPRKDTVLFYDLCLNCERKCQVLGRRKFDGSEEVIKI